LKILRSVCVFRAERYHLLTRSHTASISDLNLKMSWLLHLPLFENKNSARGAWWEQLRFESILPFLSHLYLLTQVWKHRVFCCVITPRPFLDLTCSGCLNTNRLRCEIRWSKRSMNVWNIKRILTVVWNFKS